MKNSRIYIVLAFSVILFGTACKQKSGGKEKLVVGIHSWPGSGPVFIGDEKGFFKEAGIDLQIKTIENFDTKRAALMSGQIDVDMGNTLDQLLIYRENNFDASVFVVEDFSVGGDGIIAKSNIQTLEDLKGKTVTYAEASPSDFFLRYLLKQKNIPINQIKLKPVSDAQIAGNAILAEKVDAAVTFDPWLTQSKSNKNLHVLVSTKTHPNLIPGLLIASDKLLSNKKELFDKFALAWFRSVDYYYTHQTEGSEIIARRMHIKAENLQGVLSSIHILTKADNIKAYDTSQQVNLSALISNINIFWKANGFVKKTFNPANLQTDRFINKNK
jgi:NitT/TauT family transport system substrate-binding protein